MAYSTTPQFRPDAFTDESVERLNLGARTIECIQRALAEDIASGDVTTDNIVSPNTIAVARIIAKEDGILSGMAVARAVFLMLSPDMRFDFAVADGASVDSGKTLIELTGPARAILTGERTALNFLSRMSGIATLTGQFVVAVAGTQAAILDTRKTAPGLRVIDKLAVRHGGGVNHRFGLYDMVLIKDNHIDHAGSISMAVEMARSGCGDLEIEVETRTLDEVREALAASVERILLDNMSTGELRKSVALCAGRAKLEASGNVTLANVREIAATGVDFISVGALTHSAKALDVSLLWVK